MIGAMQRVAETRVRLVVATSGAEVTNPASRAMCSGTVGGTAQKFTESLSIDAALHVSEEGKPGAGKSMAQVETPVAVDCQQSNSRSARQGLPPSFVQIRHELVHVREAIAASPDRVIEVLPAETLESGV